MEAQISEDTDGKAVDQATDAVTGLLNRDTFRIILEWESLRSRRYGTSFTLALIDIDSSARCRERNGTSRGGNILMDIAQIIQQTIRRCDIAARYSEHTFSVILTRHTAESSSTAIERIRAEAEELTRGEVTLSAGLATCPQDAAYGGALVEKAQESLAIAKTDGGNRIYFPTGARRAGAAEKPRILLVGDPGQTKGTAELIEKSDLGCGVITAPGGDEALSLANATEVNLVLIDTLPSEPDGYEVCRRLKANEDTRTIPVIILTRANTAEDTIRAIEAGADDYMTTPPDRVELTSRAQSLLREAALNRRLISIESVLISMANAVEAKDIFTRGHSLRVSDMAATLGRKMNLPEGEIDALRLGGILHDIGKIGVPGELLNRPGRLTSDEFEIVKTHPGAGCTICQPLEKTLGPALDVVRHHHERLDGSGYPDGLRGEELSVIARIAATADIFDALISNRPYRSAMSRREAVAVLGREADEGKLDKTIVGYFTEMVGEA